MTARMFSAGYEVGSCEVSEVSNKHHKKNFNLRTVLDGLTSRGRFVAYRWSEYMKGWFHDRIKYQQWFPSLLYLISSHLIQKK